MRLCAMGSRLFWKKKAAMLMHTISTMSGRMILNSDMPEAFMAVSSNFSPRLPKVMSDASSTASGRAVGTMVSAA